MVEIDFRACHDSRNQNGIGQRGDDDAVSQGANGARRNRPRKLRLDIEKQAHLLRANLPPVVQRGGGIRLPQPHIAIVDACETSRTNVACTAWATAIAASGSQSRSMP